MNSSASLQVNHWNIGQLIAFRFFTLLFVWFTLLNPNVLSPLLYPVLLLIKTPVSWLSDWVAQALWGIDVPLTDNMTGSGDRLIDFVHLFLVFTIAVVGTAIWSAVDYRRRSYNQALYWLTVLVRYYLAITMIEYGMVKLFKSQFPDLTERRLTQRYGESSPMGLAWRFLSYSTAYNYFMGFAEISGALLLLFRRTVTLGAMLTFFVSLNIMAINYCFDVPVKILSTALVVMSLFLLALDARPLISFFVLGKPAGAPAKLKPEFKRRWVNVTSLVLKCLLLLFVVYVATMSTIQYLYVKQKSARLKSGYYNVINYREPGRPKAETDMDPARWQKVTLTPDSLCISIAGGVRFALPCRTNAAQNQLVCAKPDDRELDATFKYRVLKSGDLSLKGEFRRHHVVVKLALLKAYHADSTLLMNRGFHWVNEVPFNK